MENNNVEVLLAEDNQEDAMIIFRILSKINMDLKLHHVIDGAEAVNFIQAKEKYADRNAEDLPRLLLLDLKMPKLNGFQVLQIIKNDPVSMHMPVVVMTSSNQDADIAECYSLGANSYIVKPFGYDELKETLQHTFNYWIRINKPKR